LSEAKEVTLEPGTIRYRERSTGPTIVFVHGFLVSGDHWRKVVQELAGDFRCITPDWPLGSHELPLSQDADVSPTGFARLAADFLAALDLTTVTLVGNDKGGALCQMIIADHPERIARLVLTTCDAYDNFPPRILKYLMRLAYLPGFTYGMARASGQE
jgi:pimeloyl-ACP methyl ester carboxylesterase